MVRITTGTLKGMTVMVPPRIRATQERVRQALFNILGDAIQSARVLDAFAGSGAVGLEAVSRGAREAVFLEARPACLRVLRQNLETLRRYRIQPSIELYGGDALKSLEHLARRGRQFELIVLDPPYEGPLGKNALNAIGEYGMLSVTGLLAWEHARQCAPPAQAASLARVKQHRYGDTVLSLYQVAGSPGN